MKKPSVTQLTKILDKPALMSWANKIGLEGIRLDEYRKKVMSNGTSLHKQIEMFILNGDLPENETLRERLPLFMENKEVLFLEERVENDYFTGRVDFVFKQNGVTFLCDFKTNQKGVYLENKLQLVSYSMCIDCDELYIINIPSMDLVPVDINDREPYVNIMISLSNIHFNKTQL